MKFFSEIKKVLLEKIAGDPSDVSEARFWYDSGTKRFRFRDDAGSRSVVSEDAQQTVINKDFTTGVTVTNPDVLQAHGDTLLNLEAKAALGNFGKSEIVYDTTNDKFYGIRTDGVTQKLSQISDSTPVINRTQANTFVILDAIYHDGVEWLLAQANSEYTTAEYIVTEASGTEFTAARFGEIKAPAHGKVIGEHYFLSDNLAGKAELTSPEKFSCPVYYVEDADTIHVEVYRPIEIGDVDGGSNKEAILNNVTNQATTISIDSANTFSALVEYTLNRGTLVEYGRLFIMTDSSQAFDLIVVEKIGNAAVTFDLLEATGVGTLRYTTTDTQAGDIRFTVKSFGV